MLTFAVVMFVLSWVAASWSLGELDKIVTDLGLTITVLVGIIIALFAGTVLVWNEVEHGTILPVLAKPLPRWEFMIGKFTGFSVAVMLLYAGMCVILMIQLAIIGRLPALQLIQAFYLSGWEILIVIALALMFSAFSSPSLSALFTILLFVTGRFSGDIRVFVQHYPESVMRPFLEAIYSIIPHLSYFNVRFSAVHSLHITFDQMLYPTLYGVVYCGIILFIAALAFQGRDLA